VKGSSRAYPLFSTGRLFLERPERHRVRVVSGDPAVLLFQVGDGPVTFDRAAVERNAFRQMKDQYYKEETTLGEPLKGNYTNVARLRGSGVLLGPTNYHSYQPTLRKIYEERYSRRMPFQEFTQKEIEVVTDEQTINDWREQARSTTNFTTTQEAEPVTFKSAFDAEQHFKKTYLPTVVKSGVSLECSGPASRAIPDRGIAAALRDSWEKERGFPAQIVNHLRPYLLEAGLHFFKHRKRVLYISAIKPARLTPGQDMSANLTAIMSAVEAHPKLTRRDLATKILGEHHEAPELLEQKASLARDLHYLVHAGHVIEFHDGTLDLPLPPGGNAPQQPSQPGKSHPAKQPPQAQQETGAPVAAAADAVSHGTTDAMAGQQMVETAEVLSADSAGPESIPTVITTAEVEPNTELETLSSDKPLPAALTEGGELGSPAATLVSAPSGTPSLHSEAELASATSSSEVAPVIGDQFTPSDEAPAESAVFSELASGTPATPAESAAATDSLRGPTP
jgi:hypothetical protein